MDVKELKETDTWILYQRLLNFMQRRNIFSDTDLNYRMYNGDQWAGLKISGIEKIQYNFIKPIVKHKTSILTANLFAINYSPENLENVEFMEPAQKLCDLLNKRASKVWDSDFMDKKVKKWSRQAAINDESVAYVTYNFDTDNPINEVISKNDILYGNENEDEIQLQPYILIRQRKTVIELQQMAEDEKIDKELIKNIITDNDTSTVAGDSGKDEVDEKCWLITKFYRENGTVHFTQSTQYCEIKKARDTGLTLYPIAHFNWEDQIGNARGIGEVRQLIPNQLEANKTAMRRALTVKNTAYPNKVVNVDLVENPDDVNKVGAVIKFRDMGNSRASDVFTNTQPAQMSTDSEKFQSELITYSRELNNAGDSVTGSINPESASGKAILAVQNAQNQPMNDQVVAFKSFLEDIARIWFEMWKVYAEDGLIIEIEEKDPITNETRNEFVKVESYLLEALSTSVKVDITPKGSFDKYAQELSLENLFTSGKITFEEYVKSLDSDSTMPKPKLEIIVEDRKEAQRQIASLEQQAAQLKMQAQQQQANTMDIEGIANAGNQLINQATQNM